MYIFSRRYKWIYVLNVLIWEHIYYSTSIKYNTNNNYDHKYIFLLQNGVQSMADILLGDL